MRGRPLTRCNRSTVEIPCIPLIGYNRAMVEIHGPASTVPRWIFYCYQIKYNIDVGEDSIVESCGTLIQEIVEESYCYLPGGRHILPQMASTCLSKCRIDID